MQTAGLLLAAGWALEAFQNGSLDTAGSEGIARVKPSEPTPREPSPEGEERRGEILFGAK